MDFSFGFNMYNPGQNGWWRNPIYRIDTIDGGTTFPGLVADIQRQRYALPMSISPEDILTASMEDIIAAMVPCAFSDVFTFTRSSVGTYTNAAGVLIEAPINTARFAGDGLLLEGSSVNQIRNSVAAGAVVGTPGTIPTNWTYAIVPSGVSTSIVGFGSENGVQYVDIRWQGVTSSNTTLQLGFEPNDFINGVSSNVFANSAFIALRAGVLPRGILRIAMSVRDASNTQIGFLSGVNVGGSVSSNLSRFSDIFSFAAFATAAKASPRILVEQLIGDAVDFTLRIGLPQCEISTQPSSVIKTSGSTVTRSADRCELTARAAALFQRAAVGSLVQGVGQWGALGRFLGGASNSRLVGLNSNQDVVFIGTSNVTELASPTVPLPTFGVCFGYNAAGKAGSYNATAFAAGTAMDATLSQVYLGRDNTSNFANGYYKQLVAWPARPANAALPGKAIPYA